jgi:hypothetical protein
VHRCVLSLGLALFALSAGVAHALDKVDPYICPTKVSGSGMECFLEAVPQTYTMCRQIKSIEIIEFGLQGAQAGVNGAKTEYCIDKHRLTITRPYQAALREGASSKATVEGLSKLYELWLASLAQLVPVAGETDELYKQRVMLPYGEFNEQIKKIRASTQAPAKPAASAGSKQKKKSGT